MSQAQHAHVANSVLACVKQLPVVHPCLAVCADANHTFSSGSVDWGFTTFLALRDIYNLQQKGFLVDDVLEVITSFTLPSMYSHTPRVL